MIEIVAATRLPESEFWTISPLGLSLARFGIRPGVHARVAYSNERGLPEIYNARIDATDAAEVLVFVHDDVWIDDFFFADRINDGLRHFDILGVAGNRRRLPRQPAWMATDLFGTWDERANLSGRVAHGAQPFAAISDFGATPAPCELLDGVLIAARRPSLVASAVHFDPKFRFHFYDMDFCRTARARGLRLGTWPICITHQSGGDFGSAAWRGGYDIYLEKWNQ